MHPTHLIFLSILPHIINADISISSKSSSLNHHSKLELIQVLFRNGERTPHPHESYPKDPYSSGSRYSPFGWSRLTELGRWRAHRLGRALRRHYEDQLPRMPKWPEDVYAYSANLDACRESMRYVLEALYDGDRRVVQQVAVRTMPRQLDTLMNSRECSRFNVEVSKVRRSDEVKRIMSKYEGLYSYLKDKTGLSFDRLDVDDSLYQLFSLLESQSSLNLTLPDWCPEGVYDLLLEIAYVHHELESHNDQLKRLNGGPILRRFIDNMKRHNNNAPKNNHIHLYAAEGRNVAAFARAMNKSYPRVPTYGSAIVLEKWRDRSRNFVRIVMWTGATEKMFPVQLKECDEMCPLEEFARIVARAIPSDDELKCLMNDLRDRS